MISRAIVDTGPLVAAANRADPAHASCLAVLSAPAQMLTIPAMCVAEASYLLGHRQGPDIEAAFLRALEEFDVQAPAGADWARIAALVKQYRAFPLGGTDASVIALAERLDTDLLITLDRRHFTAVRPRHCARFRIIP